MKSERDHSRAGGPIPALLVILTGMALTAGAAWALAAPADPPGDVPAEMTCHGHGQKGLGPCLAGGGFGRGPQAGPGPARGRGFGPGPGRGPGPGGGFGPGPGDGPPLRILDSMPGELALTDEQWAGVLEIMGETRKAMDPLHEERAEKHDALRDLMHAESLDEKAIRSSVIDLAEVQAEMAVVKARTRARVVALLSPDQKGYLEDARASHEKRRQRHRQFRRQMRGGGDPTSGAN